MKSLSITDIKGGPATGNRGLIHFHLLKRLGVLGSGAQPWFEGPGAGRLVETGGREGRFVTQRE
eukprot:9695462-Lingulodinium_polyedra.AAC.1